MNKVELFQFEQNDIRMIIEDGQPWWVGKDVCTVLGMTDARKSIGLLDRDERNTIPVMDSMGRMQDTFIINEYGLYSLIMRSRKPEARAFKRWVTHEVLPSIRRMGMYATDELLANPDLLIAAATELKRERAERVRLEDQIRLDAPKVLFADHVASSETSISIGTLAKIMHQNGIEIGEHRLFEWLRKNRFLITRKGNDYNTPTQRAISLGLLEIKESCIRQRNGQTRIVKTAKVTGKGQIYFVDRLRSETLSCITPIRRGDMTVKLSRRK